MTQHILIVKISDKILKDRAYEIPRNHNYDGIQSALANMVYKFFDKKKKQDRETRRIT